MSPRRNWIAEFTQDEVRAALGLIGTPESASAVAAELYGLAPEDQVHFEWIDSTLLLLSCVSDDLARRVLDTFAHSPESWQRLEADRAEFRKAFLTPERPRARTTLELSDVVHDTRGDCAVMAGVRADESGGRRNYIALFSEEELRSALELYGNRHAAAMVAADLYALPRAEQSALDWTDTALWLLSSVSPQLAERVRASFGTTPAGTRYINQMQELFRGLLDRGELEGREGGVRLEDVVRESPHLHRGPREPGA